MDLALKSEGQALPAVNSLSQTTRKEFLRAHGLNKKPESHWTADGVDLSVVKTQD